MNMVSNPDAAIAVILLNGHGPGSHISWQLHYVAIEVAKKICKTAENVR